MGWGRGEKRLGAKQAEAESDAFGPLFEDLVVGFVQFIVGEVGVPLSHLDVFVTGEFLGNFEVARAL